jgi:hypothetical protein
LAGMTGRVSIGCDVSSLTFRHIGTGLSASTWTHWSSSNSSWAESGPFGEKFGVAGETLPPMDAGAHHEQVFIIVLGDTGETDHLVRRRPPLPQTADELVQAL